MTDGPQSDDVGLILSLVGAALLGLGLLLSAAGVPYSVNAVLVSPVLITIGVIVSSRERARTRSRYAAYGIVVGCIGLACCVFLIVWIICGRPLAL